MAREKDLLTLERKCEHHATETAINNAREMQKQAAKSAKDAGKNKGTFWDDPGNWGDNWKSRFYSLKTSLIRELMIF